MLAEAVLQHLRFHDAVFLGNADPGAKVPDRFRCVAPAAHSRQRRHAGIVPAAHVPLLHQPGELALAQDGLGDVEASELDLLGAVDSQVLQVPVVEGAMILEFQGADGMSHPFDGVGLAVGEVIGGIDAPLVTGARMGGMEDPVHDRISKIQVS